MDIDPVTILSLVTIFVIALLLLSLEPEVYLKVDNFVLEAIEELTYGEGDTVTFCCENPDWDSCENDNIITCNGDWTNWSDVPYRGQTKIDCLKAALADRRKRIQLKAN